MLDLTCLKSASTLAATLVLSSIIFRRYCYEVFTKLHLILAGFTVSAIWLHLPSQRVLTFPKIYLIASSSLWAIARILHLAHSVYRNFRRGTLNRAFIQQTSSMFLVHVTLSRPWKFQAGQFVYLCAPGVSPSSFVQSHPFAVSWWYKDEQNSDVVVFMIQPRRGFTNNLLRSVGHNRKIILNGPYGQSPDFGQFGTVLMFASGAGIAAQLPFVKQLLEGYKDYRVQTRRIALYWEMELESKSVAFTIMYY